MAVLIKVKHCPKHFTQISNEPLRDKDLSLKARGLLATCLSHSNKYDISIAGLQLCLPDGRDSIRKTLNELISAGYAKEYRIRNANGVFEESALYVSDQAKEWPEMPPEPGTDISAVASVHSVPHTENPVVAPVNSEPRTENPVVAPVNSEPRTENPAPVNPQQRNNNIKEVSNNSLLSYTEREREKIELVFHSQRGYVSWNEITETFIANRTAVGWHTNAGCPIVDKVAYALTWNVPSNLTASIFYNEEAATEYKRMYTAIRNGDGAHILTTIFRVQLAADKSLILYSTDSIRLLEYIKQNAEKLKPLIAGINIIPE